MPIYNTETHLIDRAVASILSLQTPVELVLIDDGSTRPEVKSYLESLEAASPKIRLRRVVNGGVARARNVGLSLAHGEWVSFVDPDDFLSAEASDVLQTLKDEQHNVVIFAARGRGASGNVSETYSVEGFSGSQDSGLILKELLSIYRSGRHSSAFLLGVVWAKFFRREFLQRFELQFDERIVKRSDTEWIIRVMALAPRVRVINTCVLNYTIDVPGNISRRFRPEVLASLVRVSKTVLHAHGIPSEYKCLYYVELIKDCVNTYFTSVDAPIDSVCKREYLRFLDNFTLTDRLWSSHILTGSGVQRRLLCLCIEKRWYFPVAILRVCKGANPRSIPALWKKSTP